MWTSNLTGIAIALAGLHAVLAAILVIVAMRSVVASRRAEEYLAV